MAFFPLPQTCTVKTNVPTANERSGQTTDNWQTRGVYNCLYYATTGSKYKVDLVEFDQTGELYIEAGAVVSEGDRVYNISDMYGNILDTGIYEVIFIRKIVTLSGIQHHQSLKVRGVSS